MLSDILKELKAYWDCISTDFTVDLLWKELSKEKNMIKSNLVIEKL